MARDTAAANPDIAALETRQADLRAFFEDIAAIVMALPMPETFIEAERSVRAVNVADRFLQTVPADETPDPAPGPDASPVRDPHRLALRTYADRLMAAARRIPKPASFLEGERAGRYAVQANRMLVQLYTAPRTGQTVAEDIGDSDNTDTDRQAAARVFVTNLNNITRHCAGHWGFWPDGTPYEEGKAEPDLHLHPLDQTWPPPGDTMTEQGRNLLLGRINAAARYHAEANGTWPDGTPFSPTDPPFVRASVNATGMDGKHEGSLHPAPDEICTIGPWWVVRNLTTPPPDPPPQADPRSDRRHSFRIDS